MPILKRNEMMMIKVKLMLGVLLQQSRFDDVDVVDDDDMMPVAVLEMKHNFNQFLKEPYRYAIRPLSSVQSTQKHKVMGIRDVAQWDFQS